VALSDWEPRPPDDSYYEERTSYVRQGDLFQDVPLGYPWPPDAASHSAGKRKFLSGPFEPGFAMLLTPTCSMIAQGVSDSYAHPVRMLAPVIPLQELLDQGVAKPGSVGDLRGYDHLINYFYLPEIAESEFPESLALIYSAITLHHDYLEERRVTQLAEPAAVHLKYKLAALYGGSLFSHADFEDSIG
jgi:hypothetical protein